MKGRRLKPKLQIKVMMTLPSLWFAGAGPADQHGVAAMNVWIASEA
jgi:hypothetical protein